MLAAPVLPPGPSKPNEPRPFCGCWSKKTPVPWRKLDPCNCGEVSGGGCEWLWDPPEQNDLVLSEDKTQVTFHPVYSTGTAVIRGDTALVTNVHYYWEIKVLTETYGTDILIGVGTSNLDVNSARYNFASLLGSSEESYGLSYTGKLRHMNWEIRDAGGFCRGTIVGVRLDLWLGTLEFYINRKPQGISFYNLRRHRVLYPMISSTAAQSTMRLVYAGSHRSSLMVDALKVLAASANPRRRLPPGLLFATTTQFWLSLPTDGDGAENANSFGGKRAIRYNGLSLLLDLPAFRYGLIPLGGDPFWRPRNSRNNTGSGSSTSTSRTNTASSSSSSKTNAESLSSNSKKTGPSSSSSRPNAKSLSSDSKKTGPSASSSRTNAESLSSNSKNTGPSASSSRTNSKPSPSTSQKNEKASSSTSKTGTGSSSDKRSFAMALTPSFLAKKSFFSRRRKSTKQLPPLLTQALSSSESSEPPTDFFMDILFAEMSDPSFTWGTL